MNLYLIWQTERTGYDTYDSAVVVAPDEHHARHMHPDGSIYDENTKNILERWDWEYGDWAPAPDHVKVKFLGKAEKDVGTYRVIVASYNAG